MKNVGMGVFTTPRVGISVGVSVRGFSVGAVEMVGAADTVGESVGAMVGRGVGLSVGFLLGRLVLGLNVGDSVGSSVVGPMVGALVGPGLVGLELGAFDADGADVVGDAVGISGSPVGADDGAPDGASSKRHVTSSAATRHSPLHEPPTKQPELTPSLKRRAPPVRQRKVDTVSGLIKLVLATKSDALSTKITKSPLPPWKQDSAMLSIDRKSTRICP